MDKSICKARRVNDEMRCERCGIYWDYNDPDPPHCRQVLQQNIQYVNAAVKSQSAKQEEP